MEIIKIIRMNEFLFGIYLGITLKDLIDLIFNFSYPELFGFIFYVLSLTLAFIILSEKPKERRFKRK